MAFLLIKLIKPYPLFFICKYELYLSLSEEYAPAEITFILSGGNTFSISENLYTGFPKKEPLHHNFYLRKFPKIQAFLKYRFHE